MFIISPLNKLRGPECVRIGRYGRGPPSPRPCRHPTLRHLVGKQHQIGGLQILIDSGGNAHDIFKNMRGFKKNARY